MSKGFGVRHVAAGVGVGMAIGLGWGLAVESHTNEVADGKIVTATTCEKMEPGTRVVTDQMIRCFDNGVPGGNNMKDVTFHRGDPISFVDSYIAGEKNEAAHIEVGRMVIWSAMPFVTVAAVGTAALALS